MVSTRPPTSNPSSPFYNSSVTVPKASIKIGIIIIIILASVSHQRGLTVFLEGLSKSKSSQISSPFNNRLVIVPKAPITIGIIIIIIIILASVSHQRGLMVFSGV